MRGAVLPPDFDPSRQPSFCWINMDGLPFTAISGGSSSPGGPWPSESPIAAHLTVGVVCELPWSPHQAADS